MMVKSGVVIAIVVVMGLLILCLGGALVYQVSKDRRVVAPVSPAPVAATSVSQPAITDRAPVDVFRQLYRFSGRSKTTTDLFSLNTGIVRIKWAYAGDGNFILWFKRMDNDARELLENTIGSVNGQSILNVGASSMYALEIDADGSYVIGVEFRTK